MKWKIEYINEAQRDLKRLDPYSTDKRRRNHADHRDFYP